MKNKGRKTKGASLDKCFKNISSKIQSQYEDGSLKLSIEVAGEELSILEELSASTLVLESNLQFKVLLRCIKGLTINTISSLTDDKYSSEYTNYTIINSINNVDKPFVKYAVFKALQNKSSACGEIITTIIYYIMESFSGRSNIELEYGVDSCILSTVLYWAYKNGITDEIFKYIPSTYFKGLKQLDYIQVSYEETLTKTNNTFGEIYYNFKTKKIDKQAYLRDLVSENGALPIPRGNDLTTSPEFSWKVVRGIMGDGKLKDAECSSEMKEAISHIFQRYYDSVYYFNAGIYNYLIQGIFYTMNKQHITSCVNKVETDKKHIEECELKIKELKSQIKRTKKTAEIQKNESDRIRKTGKATQHKLDKLITAGLTDIEPYKNQIKQKDLEADELKRRIEELERSSTKRESNMAELENINRILKDRIESLGESREELKEQVGNLVNNFTDDNIPIKCIINSIKDYRIVICGGDKIHSTLKNMGFRNLKLVKANDKAITTNEVKYADAMVIITGLLSHATRSTPKNTAESFGTPIMYFNNQSANKLCRDLFAFLNSDGYKKRVS